MSDQLPEPEPSEDEHPIATGLAALVGVAVAIGLVLGLIVLAGTRLLGVGDGGGDGTATSERSLYLPHPVKTSSADEPQLTLAPDGETPAQSPSRSVTDKPTKSESPRKQITLSASSTTVSPMDRLDLTGVYPGGEGAILRVERFADGSWRDFGVTASVSNETFATYIQTGVPGPNRFRVVDTDSGMESNEIRVTVG